MSSLVYPTREPEADISRNDTLPWRAMAVILLALAISKLALEGLIWGREIGYANGPSPGSWMFFASMTVLLPVFQWNWQRTRFSGNCEIRLDEAGLTYACGASTFAWPWKNLGPFKVHEPKRFRSLTGIRHIRIARRSESTASRFLRMWCEPGMIQDIHDTPLDEIASRLNEYRDRALPS